MRKLAKIFVVSGAAIAVAATTTVSHAQIPGIPGIGSLPIPGGRGVAGAVAGVVVAIAMTEMLNQLSQAERQKRSVALQRAARTGKASWSSGGKVSKKASYRASGPIQEAGGRKCKQVAETITLSSGKKATSTETVCFG